MHARRIGVTGSIVLALVAACATEDMAGNDLDSDTSGLRRTNEIGDGDTNAGGIVKEPPPNTQQISKNGAIPSDLDRLNPYRSALAGRKLNEAYVAAPILAIDPRAQLALAYFVDCALSSSDWLVIGKHAYRGRLGFATEWGNGACGASCQQLVSACVFAHLNGNGVNELISVRLPQGTPGISSASAAVNIATAEQASRPHAEASFWGNFFTGSDWRANENACLIDVTRASLRRCNGDSTCTRAIRGTCASTCTSRDSNNGAYSRCGSGSALEVVTAYVSTLRDCRSPYSTGAPISRDCSSCVALVSSRDTYCFRTQWDATCVNEAKQWCQ
ncbi:MAG: hypothetical protein HY698_15705 [Deltaproteobacteria bacterium]|nr:hypothetical protein [Deltaproteobacteria bacterium]